MKSGSGKLLLLHFPFHSFPLTLTLTLTHHILLGENWKPMEWSFHGGVCGSHWTRFHKAFWTLHIPFPLPPCFPISPTQKHNFHLLPFCLFLPLSLSLQLTASSQWSLCGPLLDAIFCLRYHSLPSTSNYTHFLYSWIII